MIKRLGKQKTSEQKGEYYEGIIMMYDGITNGERVYTYLSYVVVKPYEEGKFINVASKNTEIYEEKKKGMQPGDIVVYTRFKIEDVTCDKEARAYILRATEFYKDRWDVIEQHGVTDLPKKERDLYRIQYRSILYMDEQNQIAYERIMDEQKGIVKEYAKRK